MSKRIHGYTLAEMIVTVLVLGIVSSLGASVFVQIQRFYLQNQSQASIQSQARTVFELMTKNLRQAEASSITIDQATGQPPYSRITFTKKGGAAFTYYQEGSNLYASSSAMGTRIICPDVRYVAFSFPKSDDANLIAISLTLERATYEGGSKALQLSVEKVRVHND